jgi:hypothetical protein
MVFSTWKDGVLNKLHGIDDKTAPKKFIHSISESLLEEYTDKALIDSYTIYQHLMDYWNETMKDDVYLLIEEGWIAKVKRILEKNSKGKEVDKGWTCDLIPKELVVQKYLFAAQQEINNLEAEIEGVQTEITSYEEEHGVEEGLLNEASNDKGSITKTLLTKYLKDIKNDPEEKETRKVGMELLQLFEKEATLKKQLKAQIVDLDTLTLSQYAKLTEHEVRALVVEDKWLTSIKAAIQTEIDAISQRLTGRVKELAERYENTMGELDNQTQALEVKVTTHLENMGLVWS